MELIKEPFNIFTMLRINGSLHDDDARSFRKNLTQIIDSGVTDLVINLDKVTTLMSHPLGVLVYIWRKMGERGGNLHLICGQKEIRNILDYTNLQTIIKVYGSPEEFIAGEMLANIREVGKYTVADIVEHFNIAVDAIYLEKLFNMLYQSKVRFIAVNLKDIMHVYSRPIGVLVRWCKKLKENQGELCLCNVNEDLRSFLMQVKLDTVMSFYCAETDLPN